MTIRSTNRLRILIYSQWQVANTSAVFITAQNVLYFVHDDYHSLFPLTWKRLLRRYFTTKFIVTLPLGHFDLYQSLNLSIPLSQSYLETFVELNKLYLTFRHDAVRQSKCKSCLPGLCANIPQNFIKF